MRSNLKQLTITSPLSLIQKLDPVDLSEGIFIIMSEIEIWKQVNGYEGFYEVSNFGNVKSTFRIISMGKIKRPIVSRILSAAKNSRGYLCVGLHINGTRKTETIHKLVSIAFLEYNGYGDNLMIDHIDGDKTNNNVYNLRIVNNRQNCSNFRKDKESHTSKYTGVIMSPKTKTYRANIFINGKSKYLGYFKTEIEASNAYQKELQRCSL